ncbi:MAG: ABC transporter permease [Firmicutes bacterium]|nr:ABC transporter permease [Bacillota bacterium]MBR1989436.1 ABC transporter permease [Bacillota bacterium]MBR3705655.1 ABC transporter permease [Bacillota bacterium]MBR6585715.1 ABC transporter permease [Bacillota bacterium]
MIRYIVKRILLLIPVILAVSFVVYFLMDLAPGDVVSMLAPQDATPEQIEQLKEELNLNGTLIERYGRYILDLLHGDLGDSYMQKRPVMELFAERFPATFKLALASQVVALLIALPLGITAARRRGTLIDGASMITAMIGVSMPSFWLALLLIILFSSKLGILPSGGDNGFASLIMPAIALGTSQAGSLTRITRSGMLDVLSSDYLRTARAKGVPEKTVIRKHALKNALIPIITIFGSNLGNALGGAVAIETVFSWPGVGRLTTTAVNQRDTILATGCIIMFTLFLNVTLLIVDIAYAFVDPRIKAQYSK